MSERILNRKHVIIYWEFINIKIPIIFFFYYPNSTDNDRDEEVNEKITDLITKLINKGKVSMKLSKT